MQTVYDVNLNLNQNYVNHSVSSVSGKRAISQFIVDLIRTNTQEIPFKEWEGSRLSALLGEACSNLNASIIVEQIRILIEKYIPYVEIQDITYLIDYDNQRYIITLYYYILNTNEVIEQELSLNSSL